MYCAQLRTQLWYKVAIHCYVTVFVCSSVCPLATVLPRPQSLSLCCLIHSHCSVHTHIPNKPASFPMRVSLTHILYIHRHSAISPSLSFLTHVHKVSHTHTITRTVRTLWERRLAAQHSPTTHCKLQINQPCAWLALMCVCVYQRENGRVWVRNFIFLASFLSLFSDSR